MEELIKKIENWGKDKGINDPYKQLIKTFEESGELCSALLKKSREKEVDSLGDILVCLIIYASIREINLNEALSSVWEIISKREGENINGVFVKNEDLNDGMAWN